VLADPGRARTLRDAASGRLRTDFDWARIAQQTSGVYERVWSEFLDSVWAERSLWPLRPGAEERATQLGVRGKAASGGYVARPPAYVAVPTEAFDPDEAIAAGEPEAEERVP
jgi:hypothetical protein